MIPWPIALLTLFYGALAAASAATVWKIAIGLTDRPISWPLAWLAASVGLMCGLPLLKPWARQLAIAGSWMLVATTLAIAGLLARADRPIAALGATLGCTIHLIVIRYLGRPSVKVHFH